MPALENAYALVIGIAAYQHINPLPETVVRDARDIAALLVDPRYCGYSPENVDVLVDGEATRAALRSALARLAARCDADSSALIYISCHGGRITDGIHGGEYLLPVDTIYPDETSLARSAISGDEFARALSALPARKSLVILDCCHAGGIGSLKDAGAIEIRPGLTDGYLEALQAGQGRAILASSSETESSYVLPGATNSLFTAHLLAGLRGGITSEDGLIRVFALFDYVQPRVTAAQRAQHPVFKAELRQNFPVALCLGGQKNLAPRDDEGFVYDAYISYVDREPDTTWVWQTLVPGLELAGLRIAVSGTVERPGVARVSEIERAIRESKRTVIALSEAYLADHMAGFENVLSQTMGIQEGTYRLLPIRISPVDSGRVPVRISQLSILDFTNPSRLEREFKRLVSALDGPLPRRDVD